MRTVVACILMVIALCGCTTTQSETPVAENAATLRAVFEVVNQNVFLSPPDTSVDLAATMRGSSQIEVCSFDRYSSFLIVYADLRSDTYPLGIRSKGGNGLNFVFRLKVDGPVLVYWNGDHVENRIVLKEMKDDLLLYSYCHIGLRAGPPGRNRYRWDGEKFVYLD
jgi:hypothetical protein